MANPYIWAGLERATNDPTTIDQAIAEGVAAHNDDPDAHLGPGQALESHRAAEIIDHLAESVVNDKIARQARRYIAIVDPNSESDFDTVQGAIDYAASVGGGDIYVTPGVHELTADVTLQRTCGLYGAGDGESVIVSSSSTNRKITIQTAIAAPGLYFEDLAASTSSKNFSYGYFEDAWTADMVGMAVFDSDNEQFLGIVASYNAGAMSGVFVNNSAATVSGVTGNLQAAGVFANGSNGVQILVPSAVFQGNYYVGSKVRDEWTGDIYKIIAHDTGQTIILDRNYSGTSGTRPVFGYDDARRTINIESVQLGDDNADVSLSGSSGNGTIVINNASIYTKSTQMQLNGTIMTDNAVFHCGNSTYDHTFGVLFLYNSTVYARTSSSRGFAPSVGSRFFNSKFTTSGGAFVVPIVVPQSDFIMQGCTVVISANWTMTTSGSVITTAGNTFRDNYFSIVSSYTLTFTGRHCVITGNRFERTTSGGVTLASTCNYSVFSENMMNGTPTNSGTGNVVVNNLSTR